MQPMVNIAIRAIRSTVEEINLILEREELSLSHPENIDRVINRVNAIFYDNVAKALQRAYSTHYIAEYGDLRGKENKHSWHIMPLHNPANLVRGLPDWCFSVICKKNDQTEHALLYFPATNDEYTASRGSGAALNEKRLRVSSNKELSLAVVSTNILSDLSESEAVDSTIERYRKLDNATYEIRSAHCLPLQLAYVAAGKLDATLMTNTEFPEIVAGSLIAKEAGALSGDFEGRPITERSTTIICGNPKILRRITQRLHNPDKT